ncbi:MAG: Ig-like domain repeat protein [Phycisphaerales bacterium]|nr:Ig-like domain repeat protein [Phycisphaerales bacterium]
MRRHLCASLLVSLALSSAALADDFLTSSGAGPHSAATVNAQLSAGAGSGRIVFDSTATVSVDASIGNCTGIVVNSGFTGTIDFAGTAFRVFFSNADIEMTLNGTGTIVVAGTNSAAGFDFSSFTTARTLTVTSGGSGTFDSAVAANNLFVSADAKIVRVAAAGAPSNVTPNIVVNSSIGSQVTFDLLDDTTIPALTTSGNGFAMNFTLDSDVQAIVTAAVSIAGISIDIAGDAGMATESVDFAAGLTLGAGASLGVLDVDVLSGVTTSANDALISVNGDATIETLTPTEGVTLDFDNAGAEGSTLTITDAVTLPANKTMTITGRDDGALSETVDFAGNLSIEGATLSIDGDDTDPVIVDATVTIDDDGTAVEIDGAGGATIDTVTMSAGQGNLDLSLNANTLTVTNGVSVGDNILHIMGTGPATVSEINLDMSGGALDVDISTTVTTLGQTANAAIDVASGRTLTAAIAPTDDLLTLTGIGTISQIDLNGNDTLVIGADINITALNIGAGGPTINVSGVNWTQTVPASNPVTLSGTGTIAGVDLGTPPPILTIDMGADLTITTFDPGLTGGGDTLTIAGDGDLTISSAAAPGAGDTVNYTGAGALAFAGGFSFAAAGVTLDLDDGETTIGTAGSNDNVTLTDTNDKVSIATGAALNTSGSITTAGGTKPFELMGGATLNLTSTTTETLTQAGDDEIALEGDTNITGSGKYTLNSANQFRINNLTIATTGQLIDLKPDGSLFFLNGATLDIGNDGLVSLDGQAAGTPVVLTSAGNVTINVNAGTDNLSLGFAEIDKATYASDSGKSALCDGVEIDDADLKAGAVNWDDKCGPSTITIDDVATTGVVGEAIAVMYSVTGDGTAPTGDVTVSDGTDECTGSVGDGECSIRFMTVGTKTVTASYPGDTRYDPDTSAASTVTISKASTKVTLTASDLTPQKGDTVTLTATVSVVAPGSGDPSGKVTFKDGSTTIGEGTLNSSGVATLTTDALEVGAHTLSAAYGGDTNYSGSAGTRALQVSNDSSGDPNDSMDTPAADLAVSLTVTSGDTLVIGDEIVVRVTIVNNGDAAAEDVTLSLDLPAGLGFLSATEVSSTTQSAELPATIGSDSVEIEIGAVAVGETLVIEAKFETMSAGSFSIGAELLSAGSVTLATASSIALGVVTEATPIGCGACGPVSMTMTLLTMLGIGVQRRALKRRTMR